MEKKHLSVLGVLMLPTIFMLFFVGCSSNPSSNSGRSSVPINMTGTTWVWSSGNDSSTYTFIDSTTYKVSYTGAFEIQNALSMVYAMAGGVESDKLGTGTYSVLNQTVTMKPEGGVYLDVSSNGRINMQTKESFTINIINDSFQLGAITYKKVE